MSEAKRGRVMIQCRAGGEVMEIEAKRGKVIKWFFRFLSFLLFMTNQSPSSTTAWTEAERVSSWRRVMSKAMVRAASGVR